jgi:hypothetical protein
MRHYMSARDSAAKGLVVVPQPWVVERSFGLLFELGRPASRRQVPIRDAAI